MRLNQVINLKAKVTSVVWKFFRLILRSDILMYLALLILSIFLIFEIPIPAHNFYIRDDFTLNNLIIYITFIAVVFYTYYTYKLHIESKELREQEYMPFIFITSASLLAVMQKKRPKSDEDIKVKNIGKGIALNVTIESIRSGYQKAEFRPIYFLEPEVKESSAKQETSIEAGLVQYFNNPKVKPDKMKVVCQDILDNTYCFEYRIENLTEPKFEKIYKNSRRIGNNTI